LSGYLASIPGQGCRRPDAAGRGRVDSSVSGDAAGSAPSPARMRTGASEASTLWASADAHSRRCASCWSGWRIASRW
jgi:hypothetical protein